MIGELLGETDPGRYGAVRREAERYRAAFARCRAHPIGYGGAADEGRPAEARIAMPGAARPDAPTESSSGMTKP